MDANKINKIWEENGQTEVGYGDRSVMVMETSREIVNAIGRRL